MGEQQISLAKDTDNKARYIGKLLKDIEALKVMLETGLIEDDVVRIGAEQEFCLTNDQWRPAQNAEQLLEAINDEHFTTELAKYNLEINLDPQLFTENALSKMEDQLLELLAKAREVTDQANSKIVLTGILPTIGKPQLNEEYLTERPRYGLLNETLRALRGNPFHLHLKGVDELNIQHQSVLFEACNTSFQMHLQIAPDDFVPSFNWAQAISGPVLSICANSPILLGRELWEETRIALFRQSIDIRTTCGALKDDVPRVDFGTEWAKGSVVDIFKDSIAKHQVIIDTPIEEDSLEMAQNGVVPKLAALSLHNGTIYPWNRACYGRSGNGKAHLRIENRYIPSGPSVRDEMANLALWTGIMLGRPAKFDDMPAVMDFADAKANFIKAARYGKDALLVWEGKHIKAERLMMDYFLPMAYDGLRRTGLQNREIEQYLRVIKERISGETGSSWMIRNYRKLKKHYTPDTALRLLTKAMHQKQAYNTPVDQWSDVAQSEMLQVGATKVGHIMSTRLFSTREDELVALPLKIMEWKDIHHVPVIDDTGKLKGLLTWTHLAQFEEAVSEESTTVKELMVHRVHTAKPSDLINDALSLMKEHMIGCLPVVQEDVVVGIITIKDLKEFL